jgi:hypothetical protein
MESLILVDGAGNVYTVPKSVIEQHGKKIVRVGASRIVKADDLGWPNCEVWGDGSHPGGWAKTDTWINCTEE